MIDLLIKNVSILTMDRKRTFLRQGCLAVDSGRIIALGTSLSYSAQKTIDGTGKLALPGLINTHMHECLMRGICEDLPLMEWLEKICFPLDSAFSSQDMRASAFLNQLEMIKGGVTTFNDIYRYPEEGARVAELSGLRAIFSPQIIEQPSGAGETVDGAEEMIESWNKKAEGRISIWFGPHAIYTCSSQTLKKIRRLADRYGVGIHIHLAETRAEVESSYQKSGLSPVQYLDRLDFLDSRVLAAHCVHLSAEDMATLKERNVAVAYNPSSNMKLASGVAPISELLKMGIRVGLGTDSNLSNNNLDMFEEMRMGTMLQKLHLADASALPCYEVLEMATREGARALGMEEDIGSLEVGKKADIILINLESPHLWPLFLNSPSNLVEHVVYSANASDVYTTIVDGRTLMEERKVLTLSEREIFPLVQEAAYRLYRKAKIKKPMGGRLPVTR